MSRALCWLWHELLHVLPVFLFFFVVFNIRNITDGLIFQRHSVATLAAWRVIVAALVASKVLVLADALPFVRLFANRPLAYSAAWKALIYSLATLIYRLADGLIPVLTKSEGVRAALSRYVREEDWARFWGLQLWLWALLVVFAAARELVIAIGGAKALRRLFFGI